MPLHTHASNGEACTAPTHQSQPLLADTHLCTQAFTRAYIRRRATRNRLDSTVADADDTAACARSKELDEQMPSKWINASDMAGTEGESAPTKEGLARLLAHLAEGKVQKVEDIIAASVLARKVGLWQCPNHIHSALPIKPFVMQGMMPAGRCPAPA